jgi:hypothetical protein
VTAIIVLLLVCALDAGVQPRAASRPLQGERITFVDGRVSFVAPPGFTALTAAEIAKFFPPANPPSQALGDRERTTTLTYQVVDAKVGQADLDRFRQFLTSRYEQAFRNIKWVVNEVQRMGGRDWARMESTETREVEQYHITLVSAFDGRILMFNVNMLAKDRSRVEPAVRASLASITAKP